MVYKIMKCSSLDDFQDYLNAQALDYIIAEIDITMQTQTQTQAIIIISIIRERMRPTKTTLHVRV